MSTTTEVVKVTYNNPFEDGLGIQKNQLNVKDLIAREIEQLQNSKKSYASILEGLAEERMKISRQLGEIQSKFSLVEGMFNRVNDSIKSLAGGEQKLGNDSDISKERIRNNLSLQAVLSAFKKLGANKKLTAGDMAIASETVRQSIYSFISQYNKKCKVIEQTSPPPGAETHHSVQFWQLTELGLRALENL